MGARLSAVEARTWTAEQVAEQVVALGATNDANYDACVAQIKKDKVDGKMILTLNHAVLTRLLSTNSGLMISERDLERLWDALHRLKENVVVAEKDSSARSMSPSAKRRRLTESTPVQWQWRGDDGIYQNYPELAQMQIEGAWQKNVATTTLTHHHGGKHDDEYAVICFLTMKQTPTLSTSAAAASSGGGDQSDRKTRKIRRWTVEDNHPPSWDYMKPDQYCTVVPVERGTVDWKLVDALLFAVDGGLDPATRELVNVERIQNRTLMMRHNLERVIIEKQRGTANLNEGMWFHGTSKTTPLAIATSSNGFAVHAGRESAFYGRGAYMAKNARYSHHYAHVLESADKKQNYRQLLLVNVLGGNTKRYTNHTIDRNMTSIALGVQGFDSVLGGPHRPLHAGPGTDDSLMCVVYKSSQLMPLFVVTYAAKDGGSQGHGALSLLGAAASAQPSLGTPTTMPTAGATHWSLRQSSADRLAVVKRIAHALYLASDKTSSTKQVWQVAARYECKTLKWASSLGQYMSKIDKKVATLRKKSLALSAAGGGSGGGASASTSSASVSSASVSTSTSSIGTTSSVSASVSASASASTSTTTTSIVASTSTSSASTSSASTSTSTSTSTSRIGTTSTTATSIVASTSPSSASGGAPPSFSCVCNRVFTSLRGLKQHVARYCSHPTAFTLTGLPATHGCASCMGVYRWDYGTQDGRPTYTGGADGDMRVYYHAKDEMWLVGQTVGGGKTSSRMYTIGRGAATPPNATTSLWRVHEGFAPCHRLQVTSEAQGNLHVGPRAHAQHADQLPGTIRLLMGRYVKQAGQKNGRAWYMMRGPTHTMAMWHHGGLWIGSDAVDVGTRRGNIFSRSDAPTPDAIRVQTWYVNGGYQPHVVHCLAL